jgi:hypothetical protein
MANEFIVRKGLIVNGSGSVIFDVQGSQGELFSVTDSLSGSLFSVNDISGIPILAVTSNDSVKLGTFNKEAIKVSGSVANITGSLFGTASYATLALTASYWSGSISTAVSASYALQATSASYTVTASYVLGISSSTTIISGSNTTGSFTNLSTWNFNHGLNYKSIVIETYDSSDNQIIPQNIQLLNANTASITFPVNVSGYAVASIGGGGSVATQLAGYTVSTLPTNVTGAIAYVIDALAPTWNATVVGGGNVKIPVFYNGTNWTCH